MPGYKFANDSETAAPPQVLIADDCASHRRAFAAIVEGLGWRARCVDTGEKALEACRRASFAAILMDVNMPGAGGIEAVRQIRALGRPASTTAVIVLSSALTAQLAAAARAAGADFCLAKPARPTQIVEALRHAFAARSRLCA